MDKMDSVKRRIITSMVAIVLLLITIFGITYAYFTARVRGNTNTKSAEVSAGRLELVYRDGNGLIELLKIQPGVTLESKTFTVTNTGTGFIDDYEVILEDVINELKYYDDLTYVLTCTSSSGTCNGVINGVFPTEEATIVTNSIDVGVTHTYTLTVTYNETNTDQSDDMNKTVSAKVNIVDEDEYADYHNILVYGNTKQGELPEGYTELEYIESSGTQYINLGELSINTYNTKLEYTAQNLTGSANQRLFSFGKKADNTNFSVWEFTDGFYFSTLGKETVIDYSNIDQVHTVVMNRISSTQATFTVNDSLLYTNIGTFTELTSNAYVFGNYTNDDRFYQGRLWNLKLWQNDILIRNLIPAKNSSNVLGLYDTVTNTFYTNAGSGSFTAGPTKPNLNSPMDIKSVGDLVTDSDDINYGKYAIPITLSTKNIIDKNNYESGSINDITGVNYSNDNQTRAKDYIPTESNTVYTVSANTAGIYRIHYYTSTLNYLGSELVSTDGSFTTPSNCKYIRFNNGTNINDMMGIDFQIEKGSTATSYDKYNQVNTTLYLDEPLRKIGEYTDYIDIKNGKVVRNVGIRKIDGTEGWQLYSGTTSDGARVFYLNGMTDNNKYGISPLIILGSHCLPTTANHVEEWTSGYCRFQMSSNLVSSHRIYVSSTINNLSTWNTYLQTENTKGTPLEFIYPINPIEESVNLPTLKKDYVSVTVNTEVTASKIEVKK